MQYLSNAVVIADETGVTGDAAPSDELQSCVVTRAYSWAMIGTHATIWLFFASTGILASISEASEPFCWPYFEECWRFRLPSPAHAHILLVGYSIVGFLAGAALFHHRFRAFWWGLLGLNFALFGIVSLDYRLRANEFYMLFWVNGVFLAWPNRRWTIPATILSFYFWAGTLKLNEEWLSGSVLYRDLWLMPKQFVPAACTYVVVLEIALIWGLLSKRVWVLAAVLMQLALFHLQSLSQIHWVYPVLMANILSWFLVDRLLGTDVGRADIRALVRGGAPRWTYALMALFGAMQLLPSSFRGDSTLTGQGRIFALHMFEARQQCEILAMPDEDSLWVPLDLKISSLSPRLVCDPIVSFNRAQNLCRRRRAVDPSFDFRFVMRAKRATDADFQVIVDEPGFCAAQHEYQLLRNNAWLR